MRFRSLALFALGAVCAAIIGGGVASAANDWPMIIGRSNAATAPTTIRNPAGTPLVLSGHSTSPPVKVGSSVKVTNLNADLVDGRTAGEFALTSGRTAIVVGSPDDADGYVNTARCPSGSFATGGGGYAADTRDYLTYSGPDVTSSGTFVSDSWFAVADGTVYAWVVCYNPRSTVAGASRTLPDGIFEGGTSVSAKSPTAAPQKHLP
jgi:hypothetical protein